MHLYSILQEAGLKPKEAKIYVAALSQGIASLSEIARKARVRRPTAYLVIDDLIKKNLLVAVPRGQKTYYQAAKPKALIERLLRQKDRVATILPALQKIYRRNLVKPQIRFYAGKENVQRMSEEIYRAPEIWALFSPANFFKVFTAEDNRHLFRILIRHGGMLHDLFEDTKKAREFARAKYRSGVSEVKFLPKNFKIATDLLVFQNKVALISFQNILGIIIEDQNIAQMQKTMLKFIWESLDNAPQKQYF